MKGPDCHNTDAGLSDQVEYPRGWLIKVAGGSGDTILNFFGLSPRAQVSFPAHPATTPDPRKNSSDDPGPRLGSCDITECTHPRERGNELSMVSLEVAV